LLGAGTLVYPANLSTQSFDITILSDSLMEADERIVLSLYRIENGLRGERLESFELIIHDQKQIGPVSGQFEFLMASMSIMERNQIVPIPVVRTGGSMGEATLLPIVSSSQAREGVDYRLLTDRLVFPDGVTRKSIEIEIINDDLLEGTEFLFLDLKIPDPTMAGAITTLRLEIKDDEAEASSAEKTTQSRNEANSVEQFFGAFDIYLLSIFLLMRSAFRTGLRRGNH